LPFDVLVRVKNPEPIEWTGDLALQAKQAKEMRKKSLDEARKTAKEQKKNDNPAAIPSTSTPTPTTPTSTTPNPIPSEAVSIPGPEKVLTPFLVNLIDSPGHIDFSSEVTAALRVTDGALVVVDCVEGVCVQTETVLRQALAERIKPVLFLNKLDRLFFELDKEAEEIYQKLVRTIESVNVVIATYHDELLGDVSVYPQAGSVGFGSGKQGWGFTLEYFAELYHHKFDVPVKKMMKKLWGDHFWDHKSNRWSTKPTNEQGQVLERGFNMLVLKPLKKLFSILKEDNKTDELKKFLANVNVVLDQETLLITDKKRLTEAVMKKWIPVADSLLELIVQHLPSPLVAQKYHVQNLYSGPLDDEAATSIRNCDPNGPLVMYVSKMVPTSDFSRFYAFGRIFSGSVRSGQMVRIQGPSYVPAERPQHNELYTFSLCYRRNTSFVSLKKRILILRIFVSS
jgi:elongation factor 2